MGNIDAEIARLRSQNRRCKQHAQRIKRIQNENTTIQKQIKLVKLNGDTQRILRARASKEDKKEHQFAEEINCEGAVDNICFFGVYEKQALYYEKEYRNKFDELAAVRRQRLNTNLESHTKGAKIISRCIQTEAPKPIYALKRDQAGPKGEPVGSYTHVEKELDQIARRAWDSVYQGNFEDLTEGTRSFMDEYKKHLFKVEGPTVYANISATYLKGICKAAATTASGLDNWSPYDFSILSDRA